MVDVHADAADAALVDLDLVKVRGRMGEALGRAPVVLPEVGAEAVLKRPVDGLGVGVDAYPLMPENRLPAAQIGRYLPFVLLIRRIVVDRRIDRRAI